MTARLLAQEDRAPYGALRTDGTTPWPWTLPPASRWERIGDVTQIVGGGTPSTQVVSNFGGDIPWITPADLAGYSAKHISRGARNLSADGLAASSGRSACSAERSRRLPRSTTLPPRRQHRRAASGAGEPEALPRQRAQGCLRRPPRSHRSRTRPTGRPRLRDRRATASADSGCGSSPHLRSVQASFRFPNSLTSQNHRTAGYGRALVSCWTTSKQDAVSDARNVRRTRMKSVS